MRLTIENYRKSTAATIELSPKITLIAGAVGSGKSSIIQPLQCLVTGEKIPKLDDPESWKLKQSDTAELITENSDAKSAKATLDWSEGTTEIKWPSCKLTGPKFPCSKWAAGMEKPTRIPAKELGAIIGILPTREDFEEELKAIEDWNPPVDDVWKKIQTDGWDGAHKTSVERGQGLKREWEKLAGRDFLPKTARDWYPEHWINEPLEKLQADLKEAEQALNNAIKCEGVSEAQKAELEPLAKQHDSGEAEKAVIELDNKVNALQSEREQLIAQYQDAALPESFGKEYNCPSCKVACMVEGDSLVLSVNLDEKKAAAEQAAKIRESLEADIDRLAKEIQAARAELANAQSHSRRCAEASKKLLDAIFTDPELSVGECRAMVETARKRIDALQIKTECDELASLIDLSIYLTDVLNPDGLRKNVLMTKLGAFNQALAGICEQAEWPVVSIDELMTPRFGGRAYPLLSCGQQYTVNVCMQLAIAQMDGSQIVIIDNVDKMDRPLVNGLITVLDNLQIPAVIGRMMDGGVPDFEEMGLGISYECTAAGVSPLKELVTA